MGIKGASPRRRAYLYSSSEPPKPPRVNTSPLEQTRTGRNGGHEKKRVTLFIFLMYSKSSGLASSSNSPDALRSIFSFLISTSGSTTGTLSSVSSFPMAASINDSFRRRICCGSEKVRMEALEEERELKGIRLRTNGGASNEETGR